MTAVAEGEDLDQWMTRFLRVSANSPKRIPLGPRSNLTPSARQPAANGAAASEAARQRRTTLPAADDAALWRKAPPPAKAPSVSKRAAGGVPGLYYAANFVTAEEAKWLWDRIYQGEWSHKLARRTQQYGYMYMYGQSRVDDFAAVAPIPDYLEPLIDRIMAAGIVEQRPDQLIINEYKPGQGIHSHVDKVDYFEDGVAVVCLGSDCVMDYVSLDTKEKREVLLEEYSASCMHADSRYRWTHGIQPRTEDTYAGRKFQRRTRVSLTFRKVIPRDKTGAQR